MDGRAAITSPCLVVDSTKDLTSSLLSGQSALRFWGAGGGDHYDHAVLLTMRVGLVSLNQDLYQASN